VCVCECKCVNVCVCVCVCPRAPCASTAVPVCSPRNASPLDDTTSRCVCVCVCVCPRAPYASTAVSMCLWGGGGGVCVCCGVCQFEEGPTDGVFLSRHALCEGRERGRWRNSAHRRRRGR